MDFVVTSPLGTNNMLAGIGQYAHQCFFPTSAINVVTCLYCVVGFAVQSSQDWSLSEHMYLVSFLDFRATS
jgi:hypothetical protein